MQKSAGGGIEGEGEEGGKNLKRLHPERGA